jgi:hypothetical protein
MSSSDENSQKPDPNFKPYIVWLILKHRTEEALTILSNKYHTRIPTLKVGLPKGHNRRAYGCYTSKTGTISVLNSDIFSNPFVILHEFYHHLRTSPDMQHKGTEKNANKFASDFIIEYEVAVRKMQSKNQD